MSYTHYRTMESRRDRLVFKYPHSCYTTTSHASTFKNPDSEVCDNRSYSGSYSSWKSFDTNISDNEAYTNGRGDPPLPDTSVQMGKIANVHTYEATRRGGSAPVISIEKMQIRLKLLEDSNAALHLRNQDLVAGNKSLARRLEEDAIKIEKLWEHASLLQDELRNERIKLVDVLAKQTKLNNVCLEEKCTSTDIVPKVDRELQVWEACKNCDGELEGCQREPAVTITKSELELLERDMRTLRDAVIAREEAWDKAMERERNCQQHLARLTAETITARHLCETRQDELCAVTEALTEKEFELKAAQKETLYLSKLVAKLHRYQKVLEARASDNISCSISEKDKKSIEEIAQRMQSPKGKSKTKSKCTSDKYPHSNSSSPRETKNARDQAGSLENH